MRAFFISMDALAALSIMLLMLVLMFAQDFNPNAPRGVYLKQLSMDTLSTLERSGRIGAMVDGNASTVRELMEALPYSACLQLTVDTAGGSSLATVARSGCGDFGKELQTLASPVIHDEDIYLVTMRSWYRT